jgi:hypothetical protein
MSQLVAKPVVKNKFWIVEEQGTKIATIQAIDKGGFAYVHDTSREKFPSIRTLAKKYNITLTKPEKSKTKITNEVYGFPTDGRPHNQLLDVRRYLPIYTQKLKSKSFFCAGYYAIKFSNHWVGVFCPKLITINRYEYQGPFKTKQSMESAIEEANGQ